jgi:hypothetical protein
MDKPKGGPPSDSRFDGEETTAKLVSEFEKINQKKALAHAGNESATVGCAVGVAVTQVNAVEHHLTESNPGSKRRKIQSLRRKKSPGIRKHSPSLDRSLGL